MADPRKEASKIRKELHKACYECNTQLLRNKLHSLYESDMSPLGQTKTDIANPMAFAAMVEVALLSRCLSTLQPRNIERAEIATEMEGNVRTLRRSFRINRKTALATDEAIEEMNDAKTVAGAQRTCDDTFQGTQLDGKIKIARHLKKSSTVE